MKLSSGTLAVFSPVALTEETKAKVAELGGKVGYIIAMDFLHHIFISEWAKEYPEAKLVGVEGLQEKREKDKDPRIGNEKFPVVFTKDNKHETKISDEFDADFEYEYANGHANQELVFFHRESQFLIQADLMFNLPPNEQYSKMPEKDRDFGDLVDKLFTSLEDTSGEAKWVKRFNWYIAAKNRPSFHDSISRIEQWDFKGIIPCHGDVIEENGKEIFHKVFEWHLVGKQ